MIFCFSLVLLGSSDSCGSSNVFSAMDFDLLVTLVLSLMVFVVVLCCLSGGLMNED